MLEKKVWIPILIILLAVAGCSLFYSQKTAKQEPITIIKPVGFERSTAQKTPPPGETHETGHWHGDVWHSEPHEQREVSEAEAELPTPPPELTEGQGAPVGTPQLIADRPGAVQELKKDTPEARQAYETWKAWEDKAHEIRLEIGVVSEELSDATALTEAEAKRYETDETVQRKVARRVNAVTEKLNDVYRRQREHEEKRPPFPRVQ